VYVTSVHGINLANSRTLVHALRPRIAIWNNGPLKGSREPIDVLRSSPGFEDVWQLHYQMPRTPNAVYGESVESGGPGNNAKDEFIANVTKDVHEEPSAAYIKVSAARDGSFSVTNSRNGFTKQYRAR
jgi:hypothetical protein